jgi:hypothetical protein
LARDKADAQSYAAAMDPVWYLPAGLAVLFVLSLVMGLLGAESRPGFTEGKTSVKDRWFFHSKDDYK